MPVNATVNTTRVVVQQQGRKGANGADGTDGVGIQTVRMSRINNPALRLFNKNLIAQTVFDVMTWARSTNATVKDRYGILKAALVDIPREQKEGWLIEGASTNLILQSEDFSNAAWTKTNVTVGTDTTNSPDLSLTADTLIQTVAGGSVSQTVTITADLLTKSTSVFLKQGTAPSTRLRLDLTGGTQQTVDIDITWASVDSNPNAEKLTNGWYRVDASIVNNGTNTSLTCEIFPDTSDAGLTVIAWGAQGEQNVKSSYMQAVGSTVTRTVDSCQLPLFNNLPDISNEFSFFFKIKTDATNAYIFEHDNSDFGLLVDSSSNLVLVSDTGTQYILSNAIDFTSFKSVGVVFDGTNLDGYIDGVKQNSYIAAFNTISDGNIFFGNSAILDMPSFCTLLDFTVWDFSLNTSENEFLNG